jgi:hypothetical protein
MVADCEDDLRDVSAISAAVAASFARLAEP